MASALRRVKGRDRVVQRRRRPTTAQDQPRELNRPEFDQARLRTQTYLSVDEAMAYLRGFPSKAAFYVWVSRRRIPKCRAAGLRFLRRDLDEAVQPGRQGDRSHA